LVLIKEERRRRFLGGKKGRGEGSHGEGKHALIERQLILHLKRKEGDSRGLGIG